MLFCVGGIHENRWQRDSNFIMGLNEITIMRAP